MAAPPIPFMYAGQGTFRALPRAVEQCAEHYGQGEVVMLAPVEERSKKSHDHFFVVVDEVFKTLPEHLDGRWPSEDHMRKWALIKAGFCDERSIVCSSKAEAQRLAAFVRPMDEYAIVDASAAVVTVYTAKSQSKKAMGAKVFQESKDGVFAALADLIGVSPDQLGARERDGAKNPARRAA